MIFTYIHTYIHVHKKNISYIHDEVFDRSLNESDEDEDLIA